MKPKYMIPLLFAAMMASLAPTVHSATSTKAATAAAQPTFTTPEEAAAALIAATRAADRQRIFSIIGPGSSRWLPSGDSETDRKDWTRFLAAYDHKHAINPADEGKAILVAGDDDWPFPAPLVRKGNGWVFDAKAGREEVIRRRIGRNELDTAQTLLAIVDAQREYASEDPDGNGFNDYARRFISTPGKRDGLYWPVSAGENPSPLGPLVGNAARIQTKDGKAAGSGSYHGYRYRLLEAQGPAAPGGAYDYRVGNKLIGGFAVVAYPQKYGVTGIVTFMTSHDGVVYERDLGPDTERVVLDMKRFNPNSNWQKKH